MSQFDSLFDGKPLEQDTLSESNLKASEGIEAHYFQDLTVFPPEIREEAIHRANVLRYLVQRGVESFTQNHIEPHIPALKEKFGTNMAGWRTIARWWLAYKTHGYEIIGLVPAVRNKGNRSKRLAPELEELIRSAVQRVLSAERPHIREGYRLLEVEIFNFNQRHGAVLTPPSYEGFRQQIINATPYEKLRLTKGKKAADQEFGVIKQKIKTTRVLERVEADHTRLDLFVVDDNSRLPLGRPYLTLLIDSLSLAIVGFYLGFEPPSFLAVAYALRGTILPKDGLKEGYPGLKHNWPCHGVPELLVVDNGKEFWDKDFSNVCLELGIHISSNPVKKPWLKASVERFFGSINTRLLSSPPGKSFRNIIEREDYDPQLHAVISRTSIVQIVHQWIVDDYQVSPNSAGTNMPDLAWREAASMFPAKQYFGAIDDLNFKLGRTKRNKLRREGITILYIRYHNEELASLRARDGDCNVTIKYAPGNIGFIYVLDEHESRYFIVPALDLEYAMGLTLWQHKVNRKYAKTHIRHNYNHQDVVIARAKIQEIIESEIQQTKKVKPKKSTSKITDRMRAARYMETTDVKKVAIPAPYDKAKAHSSGVTDSSVDAWDEDLDTTGWTASRLGRTD